MSTNLRVMSYNLRAFKNDRDACVRVIKDFAPDVVCLQEMPRHPFSDGRIVKFARDAGMVWNGGKRRRMSTTILTAPRLQVHDHGHGLYTVPRPQEPRGYAWAEVSRAGIPRVQVISTHLSLYGSLRAGHAEELLADQHLSHDVPWLIAGDFNELENGPAGKTFAAHGLVDAGPKINTFPADKPEKRIDFMYADKRLTLTPVDMSSAEADMMIATDHRPILVDVAVGA